jgi:mannose-1-phosphate guanylyltransferase
MSPKAESGGAVYGFIIAGGVGTRLWPRSRRLVPKQFLDLTSDETMLQDSYERLLPIIPPERILVGVGTEHVGIVREQLPDLPPGNIVAEPAGRGTAPAIGLGVLHIHHRDPEATMVVVTADHHIGDAPCFRHALLAAVRMAEAGHLVTLGITPTFPSTGYGYIRRGEPLDAIDGFDIYRAIRFTEKPDATMAQAFLDSGLYSWNSGMFIWHVGVIRGEIARQMPDLDGRLRQIEPALGTPEERAVLEGAWAGVQSQTIDYGIMEHAKDVAVIPVQIGWSDIGTWQTLMQLLPTDDHGNVLSGEHIAIDTHHTLIYSPKKLVAAIGIEGLIVVETDDALLICTQDRCQDVRRVVDTLRKQSRDELL